MSKIFDTLERMKLRLNTASLMLKALSNPNAVLTKSQQTEARRLLTSIRSDVDLALAELEKSKTKP